MPGVGDSGLGKTVGTCFAGDEVVEEGREEPEPLVSAEVEVGLELEAEVDEDAAPGPGMGMVGADALLWEETRSSKSR